MYVVVRDDLSPGLQLAQGIHAVTELTMTHPPNTRLWHQASNNLVALAVDSERALTRLYARLTGLGLTGQLFYEPDLDEVTAFAMLPDPRLREALSGLPLAGAN